VKDRQEVVIGLMVSMTFLENKGTLKIPCQSDTIISTIMKTGENLTKKTN